MPLPGDLASLGWLEQHISRRKYSSNFDGVDCEMDVIAAEATDTTDTTIWKLKIHNCCMSRIGLCLRCRELVSDDRHDRYNYMETRLMCQLVYVQQCPIK